MRKKLKFYILICIFTFFILNFIPLYAQSVSSSELIENAKIYDGKSVVYTGEVIGEVMVRGGFVWVNVYDGKNAIGVWMSEPLSKNIVYQGNYKHRGDLIEIIGVFHRACAEHGGDLDIHAQGMRTLSSGRQITHRLNLSKRNLSLALLGALCLVLILRRLKQA